MACRRPRTIRSSASFASTATELIRCGLGAYRRRVTDAPWHGFAYGSGDDPYATPGTPAMHGWVLTIPLWFVTAISVAPLLIWTTSRVLGRRRRNRAGLCPHCGYDLRATPDRCPEWSRRGRQKYGQMLKEKFRDGGGST